ASAFVVALEEEVAAGDDGVGVVGTEDAVGLAAVVRADEDAVAPSGIAVLGAADLVAFEEGVGGLAGGGASEGDAAVAVAVFETHDGALGFPSVVAAAEVVAVLGIHEAAHVGGRFFVPVLIGR